MLGIIGATESEVEDIRAVLSDEVTFERAGISFYHGSYEGHECVLAKAGVGKVNAAICAQAMIDRYKPAAIVNTGTAGGLDVRAHVGDIILSTEAIEHDMDCTKFGYQPGEIPDLEKSEVFDGVRFKASEELRRLVMEGAGEAFAALSEDVLPKDADIRLIEGVILSGDEFVSSKEQKERLMRDFSGSCCEMEGASIAHVCALNHVPFLIIRAISDSAEEGAAENYHDFEAKAAKRSAALCLGLLKAMKD